MRNARHRPHDVRRTASSYDETGKVWITLILVHHGFRVGLKVYACRTYDYPTAAQLTGAIDQGQEADPDLARRAFPTEIL